MKKVFFALLLAVQSLIGTQALAGPCTSATFTDYRDLGSTGCSIGNLTFSNFSLLTEPFGATPFGTITLNPVSMGAQAGFRFVTQPNAAAGTSLYENLISYRVTGISAAITAAAIDLVSALVAGDGSVTNVQNLCLGGLFANPNGVSGCTGVSKDQTVIAIDGFVDAAESLAFTGVTALAVVTDIALDAAGGQVSLASTSNLFTSIGVRAVPEPAPLMLVGVGFVALMARRRTRRSTAA